VGFIAISDMLDGRYVEGGAGRTPPFRCPVKDAAMKFYNSPVLPPKPGALRESRTGLRRSVAT
jgi:hypothetical protein